jgi:TRAP-type C4-dicarboxylate transport system substrate-binding protein
MTNPLLVGAYEAFGAVPTPLPWGEVYGALQTGIIQGQENPGFFLETTKIYEVTDVITCIGHNNFTTAVMANKAFYDGLSEEDQQVIQNATQAAFDYIVDYQATLQEQALAAIKEAKPDMQINTLDEAQRQPFMDAAGVVEETFIEMTGDGGQAILDQMKADLEAVN